MAQTVYIFGAGASVPTGAPTMASFIDAAEEARAELQDGELAEAFDQFFDLVQSRLQLLHAKSTLSLQNIETVLGLVEMAELVRRLPGSQVEDIARLANATRMVLAETIESRTRFAFTDNNWQPPTEYLRIARSIAEPRESGRSASVACVTFNYDVALDFALHWSNLSIDYGLGPTVRDAVPLLKLHGSLNWGQCTKCSAVRAVQLAQVFQSNRINPRFKGKLPLRATHALNQMLPHCPDDLPRRVPAIVPPSWNKTQYHRAFSSVWARTAQEISEAREIYVIGYSLPKTDSFFRDLLALGLAGGTRLKLFEVVNPDAEVSGRFLEMLGPEARDRFQGAQSTFTDWSSSKFRGRKPFVV